MNSVNVYGSNVNFQARPCLLWGLTHIGKSKTPATPAHFQNTFFKTNLNNYLRNPDATITDTLNDIALTNMASYYAFTARELPKVPVNNPYQLKETLNKEFETITPTKRAQKFFRGVSGISDEEYQKFSSYKKGETVVPDTGYAYMTRNRDEAQLYATDKNYGENAVVFEIDIPKNSRISHLNGIFLSDPSDLFSPKLKFKHEAITPAGAIYEVTKDSQIDKNGILHVYIKYLNKW